MNEQLFLPLIADDEDKSSPLKNRIRKNYRHVRKWANRTETNCFRIYDRDIKEYPLAIDFYNGRFCVHFFSSSKDSDEPRQDLYDEATDAICCLFGVEKESIFWRTRIKREKTQQYEKVNRNNLKNREFDKKASQNCDLERATIAPWQGASENQNYEVTPTQSKTDSSSYFGRYETKAFFIVLEYGVKFRVNLVDYLDTGLFLDHRETRQLVASIAPGKRLLNLFAYTCSFSVHAALRGAAFTKSVDMSNTYTDWGKFNFILNSIPLKNNMIVREDCLKFLDEEEEKYDVIVIDPPTISRSKKMEQMFDIQEDYISLISKSLKLLSENGVIFFSTNSRKFDFDESQFPECAIQDISKKTLPIDFHNQKIHRCWKISL